MRNLHAAAAYLPEQTFGSQEWLLKIMPPSRSSARAGPMKRSSVIWISAGPRSGWSSTRRRRSKMCPPLTQTISPFAMASRANRPRP
ncbi:MAG: hypothetical protein DMF83_27360 [Acidobacteria bacterium]|nr:MAG: hypothetical protein DMF83_27360 [Acidobacteriota bacterium]